LFTDISRTGFDEHEWLLEINFPNIDRVETHIVRRDGSIERHLLGDEVSFSTWPVKYRNPSIPLEFDGDDEFRIYFRINSETPLIFPLQAVTKDSQNELQRGEYFFYGLFYGSIFILALYNGAVYISLRDKSYLFYVLYILSFALVQAGTTGIGQQYLWPQVDNATTRIALFAIAMTNYFMLHFVIFFLDLKTHLPSLIRPLTWMAWCVLLSVPLLALPHYALVQYLVHGLNSAGMLLILYVIARVFRLNPRSTTFLLVAYSLLFTAIVMSLMFQAGLIKHYTYIDYAMSVAIIFEAVVLSVGLSQRISELRVANEQAEIQKRLIQEDLSQQLIHAREVERADISNQLHDSITHDLVVIRRKIASMENELLSTATNSVGKFAEVSGHLESVIGDIRNISHVTHPRTVIHLGLESAVSALLENAFDSGMHWDLHIEHVPLSYEEQLLLYRVVQEATTNIIKYASASECLVRLQSSGDEMRLIVKDDGCGFSGSFDDWGFGLRTLNEHCKSLRGYLSVDSLSGQGTTVIAILPLVGKENGE